MPDRLKQFLRTAAIMIGLSGAFTWFGVYDSNGPVLLRFAMWLVTMTAGGLAATLAVPAVFERYMANQNIVIKVAASSALIAVPVTVSLIAFLALLGGTVTPAMLPTLYVYVYAVCVAMVIGGLTIARARETAPLLEATDASDVVARFIERLPVRFRGAALWAISSEDHYLRIHTDRGEELILMRLADAVRELEGTGGLQTHRSWWVARDGVSDTRRDGGKLWLVLKSGTDVPVSRTYLSAVKAAGLT